jgi:hypothetical protein
MSTQAAIEISHLTKVFGTRTAVRAVSFTVARGRPLVIDTSEPSPADAMRLARPGTG